jgi:hypothetical protein
VRALTVRLESADYALLEGEARRLGPSTGALARLYVRAGLNGGGAEVARRRRDGLAALDRLNALTAGLPPVDAPSRWPRPAGPTSIAGTTSRRADRVIGP